MNKIIVFESNKIRRIWHKEEWYFSVVDVCLALTDSANAGAYWRKLKQRLMQEGSEPVTFCHRLKLEAADGKMRETDCANTEGLFRIIQSIPSPKAEPFKRWLASVGYERVQEIENPELAQERMKQLYEQKGYPKDWIDKRLRGIAIRQNLTDEWQERGITAQKDFAILTAEISKATFGMTPSKYKNFKGLAKPNQNLRDHMTDLELIFSMLGEKVTTEISKKEKPDTFHKNKKVAKRGGSVAGKARKDTVLPIVKTNFSQIIDTKSPLKNHKSLLLLSLRICGREAKECWQAVGDNVGNMEVVNISSIVCPHVPQGFS
jgi:DNA-damage-inducible protein D